MKKAVKMDTPAEIFHREACEALAWQNTVFGQPVSYPGHPLLNAILIMDRYHSYAHAVAQAQDTRIAYTNALRDSFIPGAGCAVHAALDVVKLALSDAPDAIERAAQHAEHYWENWERQSERNVVTAAEGRTLAHWAMPLFKARVAGWRRGELSASPYRLRLSEPTDACCAA